MSKNNVKGLFDALTPNEEQKEKIYNKIVSNKQSNVKNRLPRHARWLRPALASVVLCAALVFGLIRFFPFAPDFNNTGDNNSGNDSPVMLFTVAEVIEVYSPQSVLVEIITENRNNAKTDKNLFLVGDIVRADFNEEIVLQFAVGDIVIIGRGNTAKVDYSKKPYVAQCNSIRIEAEEDYRNIRVGVENGEGAENAGLAFAKEVYGAHLTSLPEGNSFRITDFEMLDYLLLETTDSSVSAEFSFAIKAVDEAYYAGQYTSSGTGKYEGWLILRKSFTLEYRNNGYWNCIRLENVEPPIENE